MKKSLLAGLGMAMLVGLGLQAQATEWQTNYGAASTNAAKAGRFMLLDFCGSDWCDWCIKLDKEVFDTKEFADYAKAKLVCVRLDFPKQKKLSKTLKDQNDAMAKQYNVKGFPTVVVLSPTGDLVETTGYQEGGAKKYVESLKAMIATYEQQRPKKDAENKPATTPVAHPGK